MSATEEGVVTKELSPELGRAIARAIAYSARVVLTQHNVPGAEKLASELGNNCAQNVVLLVDRFLDDGTVFDSSVDGSSTG